MGLHLRELALRYRLVFLCRCHDWIFGLSGRCGFSRDRNDDLAACVSGFHMS